MGDWKENPEVRYREGYEEGAWALYREVEKFLPTPVANSVVMWLQEQLEPWRIKAQESAAAGGHPAKILPPRILLP